MTIKQRVRAVLLRTAALLAVGVVVMLGWWQKCPVLTWLHIPCLTCGMTRSLQSLLRFDWRMSLRYHPLTVPFLLTFWLLFVREPLGVNERMLYRWLYILGALLVGFWLWRMAGDPQGWAFLLPAASAG